MNQKQKFTIEGLGGKKILSGKVKICGAKNAALKAMAASVLFGAPVELENIPDTEDIHTMIEVLTKLGAKVSFGSKNSKIKMKRRALMGTATSAVTFTRSASRALSEGTMSPSNPKGTSGDIVPSGELGNVSDGSSLNYLLIDTSSISSTNIDGVLAKNMRSSVVLTGPMLARFGEVIFPAPGGCVIGARPIDLFLKGYEAMGATVTEDKDCNYAIKKEGKLSATRIVFEKISVGATETLMMAATLANGTTILENCAKEPEILNVAEWLNACGAKIKGVGTSTITIEGTDGRLLEPKESYVAIPDRIEAGSYLFLGAICAKDLIIEDCRPDHLTEIIDELKKSGVSIQVKEDGVHGSIIISNNTIPNSEFKAFDISTKEYPGFVTDLQSPAVVYLTQVSGNSTVVENIFEGRFKFVKDLNEMGAHITEKDAHEIFISGPKNLTAGESVPKHLQAHDIRAGFAMVMAALIASGKSEISNVHLIDRGYERIEEKLRAIGAVIRRI